MADRIIIKKKVTHGGHHGGAWKVAYADFVTAMMALFIVLWLLNSSKQMREAVGGYFKDPSGTSKQVGSSMHGSGENIVMRKEDMPKLKEMLLEAVKKIPNFNSLSKQIEMTVTAEGLRIELIEQVNGTFFDLGSSTPNENGKELLAALAGEIGKLQNRVSIEGHTDSKPYGSENYSNWELSVDRANAARRIMMQAGLGSNQVFNVRGYSDQRLRNEADPMDPANRRISVIVQYIEPKEEKPEGDIVPASSPAAPSGSEGQKR